MMKTKLTLLLLMVSFSLTNQLFQVQNKKSFTNTIGMEFVYIPAGSFMMGSPEGVGSKNEHPQHKVIISKSFYMGKYEVTQENWKAVMGNNPSHFKGENLPVECISYDDIMEYIKKLNALEKTTAYRLPTEAEWEYSCRAGTSTEYYFGDKSNLKSLDQYAWYGANSGKTSHEVGKKLANNWGLYDMYGNLWEICSDWFDDNYYSNSPQTDPTGPKTGTKRVVRGSDWVNSERACRSALRAGTNPIHRDREDKGFRLVKVI